MRNTIPLQAVVALGGIFYTLVGLTMIAAPMWFFENVGHFAPFNRHFIGDLGTFTLPLGIGLLVASRDPLKHRLFLMVVLAASALHTVNHAFDALIAAEPLSHWLVDVLPLALFAAALALALIPPRGSTRAPLLLQSDR